jgi:serine protease
MKSTIALAVAAVATALTVLPASAQAAQPLPGAAAGAYVADEVVVGLRSGDSRVAKLDPGTGVGEAMAELRDDSRVEYAQPNWIARSSQVALDQGSAGEPGGWRQEQWSFLGGPGGIRVEPAWKRLAKATSGAGAASTTVAVIDTGIAYAAEPNSDIGPAPDFDSAQFVPGYDFVDGDDAPFDAHGHGTHVAATIAERITYGAPSTDADYLTGIAFGARLMPIRVLDKRGEGAADDVAAGIEWASHNGAEIINLSLQFDEAVHSCTQVPTVCKAIRRAKRRGALIVASAGNAELRPGAPRALFPGAAPKAIAVASTTEHGCLAEYSHFRRRIDLLAPGGGEPRPKATREECVADRRPILQLTFACFPLCGERISGFAIRPDIGTSMSAAHVSGVAAVVRSLGVLGANPTPSRLARRLICTARRLKPRRYHRPGLVDAAKATRARQGKC